MKIKICGVRNQEMLDFCEKNQVDFCGFNFVPTSKRKITTDFLVPKNFKPQKVGIFMDQSLAEVLLILSKFDLDIAQFHGSESATYLQEVRKAFSGLGIMKVCAVGEASNSALLQEYCNNADMILFDSDNPGSGSQILPQRESQLNKSMDICKNNNIPYGVAGGINAENILEFKQKFPTAEFLDTASGVEKDGKFDINIAQKLMKNLRS